MKDRLKKFFGKKENVILVSVIAIIIVIVILVAVFNKKEWDRKFALNKIYDVYPEDVRKLYSNMVEVSCSGDLYLNISLDGDKVSVGALDKEVLMNYMFSYLDKNGKLNEITMNMIRSTTKYLYDNEMDLTNNVNNYKFIDNEYSVNDDKITSKKSECGDVDKKYVSDLFGYSYNENELSIDVNMGYLVGNTLYNLNDEKLGTYDGDISKLRELFSASPYYRYNYVMDNKVYKLTSVEFKSRI
jgi:hypothetical protein